VILLDTDVLSEFMRPRPFASTATGKPFWSTWRWSLLPLRPRSVGLRPNPSSAWRTGACTKLPSIDCQVHSKPQSSS